MLEFNKYYTAHNLCHAYKIISNQKLTTYTGPVVYKKMKKKYRKQKK